MKRFSLRFLSLLLCAAALATAAVLPSSAASLKQYDDDDFTLIARIPEHSGCYSSQGMAVGERYAYAAQINGDNDAATITRVDMETGETATMYDYTTGRAYFDFLGHANDMDVVTVDGVEYLTVLTLSGGVVVLEVKDTELKLHGKYVTMRGSNAVSPGSLSVKSVEGSIITFWCRQSTELLEGRLDLDADTDTIKLIAKYSLTTTTPIIDGKTYNFSGWLGQGIGVVGDMVLVIITGNHVVETINHSIVLGYDLSKATDYRLTKPDLVFYLVSDEYYGLFEIEDCDVGPDGKLYFNINGRRMMNGSSYDGVLRFDAYTFTNRKPLVSTRSPSVTAEAGVGGKITPAGYTQVKAGGELHYTIVPDRGYSINGIMVDDKKVEIANTYTFSNVQGNHTIKVMFRMSAWNNPFTDVTEDDWFREDVEYVNRLGLMRGTQDTVFSPEMTLTRAQMVTMLWRMAGEPAAQASSFGDVPAGLWYSDAVAWAAANGIVGGYGDGNFYPDNALTREQAMAIFHRYAGGAEAGVNDATYSTSEWAKGDVSWAAEQGMLQDIGADISDMTAPANRGEVAAYLTRFYLNVIG